MTTLWEQAEAARDEALANVQVRSVAWRTVAYEVLQELAERQPVLTSEDLFRELDRRNIPRPIEARAAGAVMVKAKREGLIAFAGYSRSTDPKHHRDVQARWRSLRWSEAEAREAMGR